MRISYASLVIQVDHSRADEHLSVGRGAHDHLVLCRVVGEEILQPFELLVARRLLDCQLGVEGSLLLLERSLGLSSGMG